MEIVCDCANARVVGEGHLGAKPLDGSDPVEQAEKIAQVRPWSIRVTLQGWFCTENRVSAWRVGLQQAPAYLRVEGRSHHP